MVEYKNVKKKNLLFFTRTMGLGGTEKVIIQLCSNLKDKFNKIVVCSCGGIYEQKLKDMGIIHYKINDIEKKSFVNIVKNTFVLMRIIKEEKIDIIHTHHRMAAFYIAIINKKKKMKFIHTAHNIFEDKKILTCFALKNATVVAVGKEVKNNLVEFYKINQNQIKIIYNAIKGYNKEIKIEDKILRWKEKGYVTVGNIGRLSQQKGMKYYIDSINLAKSHNLKVKFFIIGDGEDRSKIENKIRELGLSDEVFLLGYREDIQNIMKQLDFIVLSSLWEGFPLTPIEAFSVSKPVIATNIPGTNEIVIDDFNGILVKAKDSKELYEAIEYLYNNTEKMKEYSMNAYKTYIEKFSYDQFVDKYLMLYN